MVIKNIRSPNATELYICCYLDVLYTLFDQIYKFFHRPFQQNIPYPVPYFGSPPPCIQCPPEISHGDILVWKDADFGRNFEFIFNKSNQMFHWNFLPWILCTRKFRSTYNTSICILCLAMIIQIFFLSVLRIFFSANIQVNFWIAQYNGNGDVL